MEKFIVFILGSAVLAYISRANLLAPRSHGFYRFIAWEAILALFLLNVDSWFSNPFAWHQIISWVLLFLCIVPVVYGTWLLRTRGRPDQSRQDESLIGFEKTTALVTDGIYHYIRHPLYSSLLLLAWGIFFKLPSWPGDLFVIIATVALTLTARVEEQENIRFFGSVYSEYKLRTRMFIPFLF